MLKTLPIVLTISAVTFAQPLSASSISLVGEQAPEGQQTKTVESASVDTTLKTSIDSKKAKQGDEITATVGADTPLPNGTKLAKGSLIVGHVTNSVPYDKAARTPGSVTFVFDQIKTKDGQTTPILCMVRSLKAPLSVQYQMDQSDNPGGQPAAPSKSDAPVPNGAIATSISNVMLAPPADASASGIVLSVKQNVHVESGAQLNLAVGLRPSL